MCFHLYEFFYSSLNSFSYRGSYFKCRGEGSQIFWIRFGGLSGRVSSEVSFDGRAGRF